MKIAGGIASGSLGRGPAFGKCCSPGLAPVPRRLVLLANAGGSGKRKGAKGEKEAAAFEKVFGGSAENSSSDVPPDRPGSPQGFRLTDRMQEASYDVEAPASVVLTFESNQSKWPHGPDVLYIPDIRKELHPRPSPFVSHNYFGGGFVSDEDRVYLASMVHGAGGRDPTGIEHSRRDALEGVGALGAGFALGGSMLSVLGGKTSPAELAELERERELGVLPMPRFALRAGPRETIYHDPSRVKIAIVTVGGLCPGLNDVIRSIVSKASDYGVPEGNINGIQFGFKGFKEARGPRAPLALTRRATDEIHLEGGTVLGTSGAKPNLKEIVKWLDLNAIDMLFVVGGIGGISVAHEVVQECERRNVVTSVIAVPKALDNDILLIDKTFGFDTAVEEAQKALMAAKVEASSAYRGIGLVKLMGRQSGFIAVKASLASGLVDVCLIPEVSFRLDGDTGLVEHLEKLLEARGHAMICVAEGAAQELIPDGSDEYESEGDTLRDSSAADDGGHKVMLKDVGPWLKKALKKRMRDVDIKYIDPSYLIRSVPPTSNDRIECKMLAHGAVHAGFAGYTGTMVGLVNTHYVYLPLAAGRVPRRVDPKGALWNRLRASTGQPNFC